MPEQEVYNWCLIESDPAVFTEMIKGFGVVGVEVQEVYSLNDLSTAELGRVYGLVFLFAWEPGNNSVPPCNPASRVEVYFSMQVMQNACASQALINLLLNCDQSEVELGDTLTEFKSFTGNMDPPTRGLCLTNCEKIRKVHNSFARPLLLETEPAGESDKQKPFHFITYIPKDGHVFELDGLASGPVDLGTVPDGGDWLDVVRAGIQSKVNKFSAEEIRFSLLAAVPDKKLALQQQLESVLKKNDETSAVQAKQLQEAIELEDKKLQRYKLEVNRYRHNYVPFIVELLKVLAKEGKLTEIISEHIQSMKKVTQGGAKS